MQKLKLTAKGLPAVEIALRGYDAPLETFSIEAIRATVCTDVAWTFEVPMTAFDEVRGNVRPEHCTYQLYVNDTFVPTQPQVREDTLILTPFDFAGGEPPQPFKDYIGTAAVEIRELHPGAEAVRLFSEPVLLAIPQGPVARFVRLMADTVVRGMKEWGSKGEESPQSGSGVTDGSRETDLRSRLHTLEGILKTYEQQAMYFRANAHFSLVPGEKIEGVGRLTGFSESALRYVIEHPDELALSENGQGIRIQHRAYVPQHMLVQTSKKSFDVIENQVVLGFLKTIEEGLQKEITTLESQKARMPTLLDAQNGYICSAEAMLGEVIRMVDDYTARLRQYQSKVRKLFFAYSQILPVKARPVTRVPQPTQFFLSIPAYRMIYDGIVQWMSMGALSFTRENILLTCVERSRLYEHYCLVRILDALKAGGLTYQGCDFFPYERPGYTGAESTLPNTFRFSVTDKHDAESRVTLYYEPVIRTPRYSGANGLSIMRTSLYAWRQQGEMKPLSERYAYYTPDFVAKVERADGRTIWLIADAKYSRDSKVKSEETQSILFKYLFSLEPVEEHAVIDGVWLLLPWGNEQHAIERVNALGERKRADITFELVSPEQSPDTPQEGSFAGAVLAAVA